MIFEISYPWSNEEIITLIETDMRLKYRRNVTQCLGRLSFEFVYVFLLGCAMSVLFHYHTNPYNETYQKNQTNELCGAATYEKPLK